jgi:hypothetical protein
MEAKTEDRYWRRCEADGREMYVVKRDRGDRWTYTELRCSQCGAIRSIKVNGPATFDEQWATLYASITQTPSLTGERSE